MNIGFKLILLALPCIVVFALCCVALRYERKANPYGFTIFVLEMILAVSFGFGVFMPFLGAVVLLDPTIFSDF